MIDFDADTDMDMDDVPSPFTFSMEQQDRDSTDRPTKIRKKPGRKPNPASPALRKAQNRAAQRAFRERKERHMRELEVAIKQIRTQRDKLFLENEQLKQDAEIIKSENWYLKGIVLTLQLVCYQHNLVIPQHSPFVSEQALSLMAQSTPEPISAYLRLNANSKLPTPTQLSGYRHSIKQRDRYLSSGTYTVTKDDVSQQQFPPSQSITHPFERYRQHHDTCLPSDNDHLHNTSSPRSQSSAPNTPSHKHTRVSSERDEDGNLPMPTLSPVERPRLDGHSITPTIPQAPSVEPITSNLAAIQTLRLRLRLQSACARMDSIPFSIQPSILQLTIPHDPRIDLIPTPHMRDRMILFREQFDLDDCFNCILHGAVFHGDDPGVAANWQLPKAFFEKYWFLTIDYTLRRTTNRWRRLQGLNDLENDLARDKNSSVVMDNDDDKDRIRQQAYSMGSNKKESTTSWGYTNPSDHVDTTALANIPALENQHQQQQQQQQSKSPSSGFDVADLSSYLGVEFSKLEQKRRENQQQEDDRNSAFLGQPTSPNQHDDSFEPVRLTNGYLLPTNSTSSSSTDCRLGDPTSSPHSANTNNIPPASSSQHHSKNPWENMLSNSSQPRYDLLVNNLLHPDT
ncbi:hypothetical protein BC941DRAFT_468974 [Chlamydoabsidia padenii]|nr:hypothetical protein BC941DRAFT_468974 [Chlamydoabsidia padenii]